MAFVNKLRYSIGRPQNDFLFTVHIPNIPALSEYAPIPGWGAGIFLSLQIKSTSIPKLERQFKTIRTGRIFSPYYDSNNTIENNRFFEFTLPQASTSSHVWNVRILIDEQFKLYNFLYEWYLALDSNKYEYKDLLTDAYIMLYSGDKNPTKMFRIVDMYPVSVPGIDTLNYDGLDSLIEMELNFAYNYIQYDLPPDLAIYGGSVDLLFDGI